MKISSSFDMNTYINRYTNAAKLLPQSRQTQGQQSQFLNGITSFSNNSNTLRNQNIRNSLAELAKRAKTLELNQPKNTFDRANAIATSSNSKIVTATSNNGAAHSIYSLEVSQIARAQENTGDWLNAGDNNLSINGQQGFAIDLKGKSGYVVKSANFNIPIQAGEENKDILGKMADAINNRKELGVTAKLETAVINGTEKARLVITGTETGTNGSNFAIRDTAGSLVAKTKVDSITTATQNAKYKLNGFYHESETNEIRLDYRGQVTATLKNITDPGETVNINVKPQDQNAIYNDLKGFITQYNRTVKAFGNFSNNNIDITEISVQDRNKLASIGVTVKEDMTLSIDEYRFKQALANNTENLREIIGGKTGFVTKVEAKINEAPPFNLNTNITNFNPANLKGYHPGNLIDYFM